jgi:hypothetical protein
MAKTIISTITLFTTVIVGVQWALTNAYPH